MDEINTSIEMYQNADLFDVVEFDDSLEAKASTCKTSKCACLCGFSSGSGSGS